MKKGMELGLNTIVVLIVVMIVLLVVMLYFTGGAKSTYTKMKSFAGIATSGSGDVAEGIGGIVAGCPSETFKVDCTETTGGTRYPSDQCASKGCTCRRQGTSYICVKSA